MWIGLQGGWGAEGGGNSEDVVGWRLSREKEGRWIGREETFGGGEG